MGERGHVYVMHNCSFTELKIGKTARSPEVRAKELSATSVPRPFVPLFSVEVADAGAVEARLHERFSNYRVDRKREFFWLSPHVAIRALLEEAGLWPAAEIVKARSLEITEQVINVFGPLLDRDLSRVIVEYTDDQTTLVCHIGRRHQERDVLHRDVSTLLPPETICALPVQGSDAVASLLLQVTAYRLAVTTPIFSLSGKQLILDIHQKRNEEVLNGESEESVIRRVLMELTYDRASIEHIRDELALPELSIDAVGVYELTGGRFVLANRSGDWLFNIHVESIRDEELSPEVPRSYAIIDRSYVEELDPFDAVEVGRRYSDHTWLSYGPAISVSGRTGDGKLFMQEFHFLP